MKMMCRRYRVCALACFLVVFLVVSLFLHRRCRLDTIALWSSSLNRIRFRRVTRLFVVPLLFFISYFFFGCAFVFWYYLYKLDFT
jgi:hypothetical protein